MGRRRKPRANPRRMIVLLAYLNSAGPTPVDELARRFSCQREHILADLETSSLVGLPPYTADCLVEFFYDEDSGLVSVDTPPEFKESLPFSEYEAFALIAAARTFASTVAHDDPVLASAVTKTERHLGVEGRVVVNVPRPVHLGAVTDATAKRHALKVRYRHPQHGPVDRHVEPTEVFLADGRWYVAGADEHGTVKRFRVDRILDVTDLGAVDTPPPEVAVSAFVPGPDALQVRVRLPGTERWAVQRYPASDVLERDDGSIDATFTAADPVWLATLVLRTRAVVLSPTNAKDLVVEHAEAIVALYE